MDNSAFFDDNYNFIKQKSIKIHGISIVKHKWFIVIIPKQNRESERFNT